MEQAREHDVDGTSSGVVGHDALICTDAAGRIVHWNEGAERLFGFKRQDVIGKSITIIIPSDRHSEEEQILKQPRQRTSVDGLETLRQASDGSLRPVLPSIAPICDDNGKVIAGAKHARPVVQDDRSLETLKLQAREAEHRAKNILAAVMATVRLSQADSVEELKNVISGRIAALADVTSLTGSRCGSQVDIRDVVTNELWSTTGEAKSRVTIDGPAAMLTPDKAQGVAMITHELVTNSIKYGALSRQTGRLNVEWSSYWNNVDLHWSETGLSNVVAPSGEGFGSRLIRSVTSQTLRGRSAFFWTPAGLMFKLSFPLDACHR